MSPPKVSLAGKGQKPVVVGSDEAELPAVNETPAVINVERCGRVGRQQWQRRRTRHVICGVAFVIIVAVAALGTMAMVHRMRRHHRKHWSVCYGQKRLNENVDVDHNNKLITVQHDHDDEAKTPAVEILHEYGRGMVAYKDVDKKVCYIDRLDETFETGYERWEAYEATDRKDPKTLKVIGKPIEVEVLQHICDIHITAHCADAKSVWVMEIEEKEVTTQMEVVHM